MKKLNFNEQLILSLLYKESAKLTAKELYRSMITKFDSNISVSGLYVILRRMEKFGLIVEAGEEETTQGILFGITPAGLKLFVDSRETAKKMYGEDVFKKAEPCFC